MDDPATCKTIYTTECRQEAKQYPRQETHQECIWETYEDCYEVAGRPTCTEVAKDRCLTGCEVTTPKGAGQCIGRGTAKRPNRHFVEGAVCKVVAKQHPRQEKRQECRWETYQDCYEVTGRPNCTEVAKDRCLTACQDATPKGAGRCIGRGTTKKPNRHFVEGAVCKVTTKEQCKQVHKEVPYQTQQQVCPGGNSGNNGYGVGAGTSSVDPREVANAFNNEATRRTTTRRTTTRSTTTRRTTTTARPTTNRPVIDPRSSGSSTSSSGSSSAVVFPS